MHVTSLRFTSSEPANEEGVVGEEEWDAGDGAGSGYETSKCPWSSANTMLLISCFTLFLVCGKEFHNLLQMKLLKLRRSPSVEAAAAAHDISIVNAFSSITSYSSILFIFFFFFGGTGTGRELTICFLLVLTTGCPAVLCSLQTIWKISTIK